MGRESMLSKPPCTYHHKHAKGESDVGIHLQWLCQKIGVWVVDVRWIGVVNRREMGRESMLSKPPCTYHHKHAKGEGDVSIHLQWLCQKIGVWVVDVRWIGVVNRREMGRE